MTSLPLVDPASRGNSSFSTSLPGMQLALDSTSLSEFKTCPRRYYYSILRGLAPHGINVHLQFGIWMHRVRELYDQLAAQHPDWSHDAKLDEVLDWALNATWDTELGRPWISGHAEKNRLSLIQTLVWYLDAFGRDDPFETLILANGKPAVELSFSIDSGLATQQGERLVLCGHIDRLARMGGTAYVKDIKTSTYAPDAKWAAKFTPHIQFSMYVFAARNGLGQPIRDLIVDGIQVGATFARFGSHLVPRTDSMLDEWFEGIADAAQQMEDCAASGHWPMRETSCEMYGGCPFRPLCARSPEAREAWVSAEFVQRGAGWDPLRTRES